MHNPVIEVSARNWQLDEPQPAAIRALEAGKVLLFSELPFPLRASEQALLTPDILAPGTRNISLTEQTRLKGAQGTDTTLSLLNDMLHRFRSQAQSLVSSLLPRYAQTVRLAATSFRPMQVESRDQSWRSDDRRLHVDAFPSRPNRGERILRVFTNINPAGEPRVWRIGEPFEQVARQFLPTLRPYAAWQARLISRLGITKSLRSEYDHLMLQLHDSMKRNAEYQQAAPQVTTTFPAGSTWVCFSDQVPHAGMAGQYMLEQTLHLSPENQYQPDTSPLAVLRSLTGKPLTPAC